MSDIYILENNNDITIKRAKYCTFVKKNPE
jgi:hypothetical protein